jgi:hypothetical protein
LKSLCEQYPIQDYHWEIDHETLEKRVNDFFGKNLCKNVLNSSLSAISNNQNEEIVNRFYYISVKYGIAENVHQSMCYG